MMREVGPRENRYRKSVSNFQYIRWRMQVTTMEEKFQKTILIVEDEVPVAMKERTILENHGFEIVTAYDAQKAIRALKEKEADLILMDIDLGKEKMDGAQAAEIIQREQELPIVFLTGHTEKEYVERVRNVTSYGYVLKTAGEFVLLESISEALELFEARQDLKREKRKREKSEMFLKATLNGLSTNIALLDNQSKIVFVNKAWRLFAEENGASPEKVSKGVDYLKVCDEATGESSEGARQFAEAIRNILGGKEVSFNREYPCHSPDTKRWFMGKIAPIRIDENYYVVAAHDNITQLKLTEQSLRESEQRYKLLFENANESIVIYQDEQTKLFNQKTLDISGYSEEEYKKLTIADIVHPEDRQKVINRHHKRMEGEISDKPYEYRIITKSGEVRWLKMKPARVLWDGKPATLGIIEDITELKRAEAGLQKSLEEKEFLMKELNHRIKNNLVMISSLVNMKDAALGTAVDLSDISRQIDAIRIVHDKLVQSEEITHIDLGEYIQELLSTVFSFSQRSVEIENTIRDVFIRTRTAIPIGLIVNEIATNAIKHGFTPEEEARFTVDLQQEETEGQIAVQYVLTIANTGRPFPEEIELDNPETLGLQLVSALVEQLEGTIELQRNPHPVFTIRFPEESG
jgi:PAS domain S-box-containing protein